MAVHRETSTWARAIDGLEQLATASLRLTAKSFGSSMASCMRQKQWQQPLHLLRDMNFSHPSPNLITFNSTISACGTEHWHFALDLLSNLQNQRFVLMPSATVRLPLLCKRVLAEKPLSSGGPEIRPKNLPYSIFGIVSCFPVYIP